jgi:hypothetical protein
MPQPFKTPIFKIPMGTARRYNGGPRDWIKRTFKTSFSFNANAEVTAWIVTPVVGYNLADTERVASISWAVHAIST